jgi:hypothetical protein
MDNEDFDITKILFKLHKSLEDELFSKSMTIRLWMVLDRKFRDEVSTALKQIFRNENIQ